MTILNPDFIYCFLYQTAGIKNRKVANWYKVEHVLKKYSKVPVDLFIIQVIKTAKFSVPPF